MSHTRSSLYETRRQKLAGILNACPQVTRHDTADEKEAWTLAHAFLDLEQSFEAFTHELLPKLEGNSLSPAEISDVLHVIGEEFRHILYHIGDPNTFDYLPPWGGARESTD